MKLFITEGSSMGMQEKAAITEMPPDMRDQWLEADRYSKQHNTANIWSAGQAKQLNSSCVY